MYNESNSAVGEEAVMSKEGETNCKSDCAKVNDLPVSEGTNYEQNDKDSLNKKNVDAINDSEVYCDNTRSSTNNTNIGASSRLPLSSDLIEGTANDQSPNQIDMDIDSDTDDNINGKIIEPKMEPIMRISFRDKKIENCYKNSLLKYLTEKIKPTAVLSSENGLEVDIYVEETQETVGDDFLDFSLDTTPSSETRDSKVPFYGKNNDVLLSNLEHKQIVIPKSEKPNIVCFNCCGNHVLRDCPHPKDAKETSKNRNIYQAQNPKVSRSRYHLDENQRFCSLVPGELSRNLRNALDLRKDQMPLFIYRMRLLGYPPAWLEEAKISHSGMAVYDENGVPVVEGDEEEGEIIPEGARDRYDISKIIDFPGFNVPLPKNMKEEGRLHSCPGMSDEQSKENLIKTLEPNAVQAYKRRSLNLQKDSPEIMPEKSDLKRRPSLTLEEMEEKKRQLLIELDEDGTSSKKSNHDLTENNAENELKTNSPTVNFGNVKNMDLGTPVLKSVSPYSKLPSRERFSVNVSDVINFENLPHATGKYESMSSLISKIRDTVSKRQSQD